MAFSTLSRYYVLICLAKRFWLVLSRYTFPLPYTLFRVSSLAALGSTAMEGEDGVVVDLIKVEKVSLPVLMESSTEV